MADDPLRHPLEAISAALTVLYEGNRAAIAEAGAQLEKVVRAGADQVSAAVAQAGDAAKLINDAGAWSAEKLRTAAEEVASLALEQTRKATDRAERAAVYAQWGMVLSGVLAALVAAAFVYLSFWVFPVR